ncbi:hypothetical protein V2H29_17255 [Lysinibacillus fusiformis]|uniref:ACT domain-containing protein n=1 Tax=Lysinibacillus fusiformis TaxID=28031 RepID=A0A2I0UYC6_9BACI|nr:MULTISPECIES: hypothetical protein [Lysinibacillus]MEE3808686.1 hypothetical protein [Lysinibacillus fusiformis]PKU51083.1 hypothetical protein CRI88_15515 [Lysinibacillus fusiformis]WCH49350.1 hypothetical protein NV349_08215 [Lysinibacillus sp. OF-1]
MDRFFELLKLVKQSGANIDHVNVTDRKEVSQSTAIGFDMMLAESIDIKEELLVSIKKSNWEVASFYENKK